ncbi:serine/threonine-protein kinase [Nannocystis pusilla]|uniref:serine/threonine-protein kinase n=1 Tax=Nannocystis pusilla TaxID=889268 RepID=UPI003B77552B
MVKQLGAGGMGTVYKAYDPDLDRTVAIKLLHGAAVGEARARMIREAQAMAKLSHPNVVPVFDVGAHREDQVFIAMDLVEGTDLRQWMATRPRWTEVVDVFAQAGAGLAAAHAVGLVHRDFKPDNVLLSTDAATGKLRAQVADFGLARRDEEHESPVRAAESASSSALDTQITRYGAIVGTPAYMSPEQHAGVAVDPRTDQFSFAWPCSRRSTASARSPARRSRSWPARPAATSARRRRAAARCPAGCTGSACAGCNLTERPGTRAWTRCSPTCRPAAPAGNAGRWPSAGRCWPRRSPAAPRGR